MATARFMRSSPLLIPALLLVSQIVHAPCAAGARKSLPSAIGSSALAYTPIATWGLYGAEIANRLGVKPGVIYLIDRTAAPGGPGRAIGDPERYWAHDAKVSPEGDLIAFHGRVGRATAGEGSPDGVGVLELDGRLVTFIPRGSSFAWSPRGRWLAVVLAVPEGASPAMRGLALWDSRTQSFRTLGPRPSRVGWAGEDSLLLQLGSRVHAINPRTGLRAHTAHHGTVVSQDRLYSIWPGQGGENTKVIEDETGLDVTDRLFGPMERKGLRQIRSAFWVGIDHLMCVSGSDNLYGEKPMCRTALIDAATGETIVEFPGEAIGPTADGKRIVVLRHETGLLEAVDFEEQIRGRVRDDGEVSDDEFY